MRVNNWIPGLLLVLGWISPVLGAPGQADCEVRKDGNRWKGASGLCVVSERRGYISIRLSNGDSYELRPAKQSYQYRDQRNNRVVRRSFDGGQQFLWEGGKEILVRWERGPQRPPPGYGPPAAELGRTPYNLRDLLGTRSNLAINEMWRRGYELRGDRYGQSEYAAWRERSSGRCVMTRNAYGRLVSAVYAPEGDCRR